MTAAHAHPAAPEPVGRTFVCYARHDEAFVTAIADALRERGIPIWIDQRDIEPGADWSKAIDAALNACTRFLVVLSPEAVRSEEVRGELRVALNEQKHIVPLLYRPCQIPRQLLLRQHVDFTRSPGPNDASIDRLVRALRIDGSDTDGPAAPDRDDSSRQTLLDDVSAEAKLRLDAVNTDSLLPIVLESQPHQVARPWDDELSVSATPRPGPTVTNILDVFDDDIIGRQLLILGSPGSGKTTMLLKLMRALAARAAADAHEPVPVLLSLASWTHESPIGEWLVREMKVKYGVRPDLALRWRYTHRLAILLDGLDELPPDRMPLCVDAINEFTRADRPSCLVVSCRQAEYENLAVKLRLGAAVALHPLDDDAIRRYLAQAGRADLWKAIQLDPDLIDMARSPLLLSFMTGLTDGPEAEPAPRASSVTDRRRRLLDRYVSALTPAAALPQRYRRAQLLTWLRQLATMLKREGRTEFLIEQMQPPWLETRLQRWGYRAGVFTLSALLVAAIVQMSLTLFELVQPGHVGLALRARVPGALAEESSLSTPLLWMFAAVVGAVIASRTSIVPIETLTWSWTAAWTNLRRWSLAGALAGLDYGLALGVAASAIWLIVQLDFANIGSSWETIGQFCGTIGSVVPAAYFALIRPSSWLPLVRRPRITRQAIEALVVAVLYELFATRLFGSYAMLAGPAMFAVIGLSWMTTERARRIILLALGAAVVCGLSIAAISAPWRAESVPLGVWFQVWGGGAIGVGTIGGMAIGLIRRTGEFRDAAAISGWRRWRFVAAIGALAIALGASAAVSLRAGYTAPVNGLALIVWGAQTAIVIQLSLMVLGGMAGAIFGSVTAGVLGALGGLLGGATGADVERRLVPNQGIRQSAMNVVLFAALGVVVIGIPYGLFNLTVAAIAVQMLPSPSDWLRLGLGAGVSFGLLAGLLPGAACIQHFVLRTMLWASGTLPLRFNAFLDFATQRRLLQRVGGRYRFIHVLLRDYLGAADRPIAGDDYGKASAM